MLVHRWVALFAVAGLSCFVHAEDSEGKKIINVRKSVDNPSIMHITYASPSWNTDSTKVDTASIIMRDKSSGQLVTVQLEETEPDSSQFTGQFSVRLGEPGKAQPEVYIPPPELRGKDPDNKKLLALIQAGKVQRRPVIWKRNDRGQTVADVYDTREQAETGLKTYQEEQRQAQELRKKRAAKGLNGDNSLAAVQAAERKAQLDKLALEATQRAEDRARIEEIERQKTKEREEQARRMTEKERAARRAQAKELSAEALVLYDKGDYAGAEKKFKAAVDLDPDNKDYYYKYGVTLYRNQKYNDALVILKLATVEPNLELEKKYYMGLVYYRLAELDNALGAFGEVAKSNDKTMGPSALFYVGVIQFAQEKYEPSKKSFEDVIDNSSDPRLDQQAEDYIEKIASAMMFKKLRENKWTLMGLVGFMYDSNVLLNPLNNEGSGAPTNSPDFRLLTLADLQYRPIFSEHNEFTPHVTFNLTNSEKASSAPADPWLFDIAAPYSYKGMLFSKNWKVTVTPGYEILYMDPNKTGTKSLETASYFVTLDNTFVMSKSWFSNYELQYRRDTSFDPSSVGPDNLTANMYTYRTTQTFMVDSARKQMLMPTIDYIRDAALGGEKTYNRYDLGITYVRPVPWTMNWNIGFNYYNMSYPGTFSPNRVDKDYSFTTGISKPIREWVTWGLTGTYTDNQSTDPSYAYTKYVILTTATFVTNF